MTTTNTRAALTAGVAALTIALAPGAFAQGKGHGEGNGKHKGHEASQQERGHGRDKRAERRQERREDRAERRAERREERREDRRDTRDRDRLDERVERRIDRAIDRRIDRREDRREERYEDRVREAREDRREDRRERRYGLREDLRDVYLDEVAYRDTRDYFRRSAARGLIDGCPPGLAKKRNGCLPPGQAKKRYRSYDPGFFGYRSLERGSYFYDDGYLLSYRGDGLASYLPLLGGALGIGEIWPNTYRADPLPAYYSDYYGFSDTRGYRYADNVVYRVDAESAAILGVAALLTGDDITIGQPMPSGYDVYNVPYEYRDRYYDSPQARYRYSDGYVYEIDPETALVVAAIDLLS